MTLKRRLLHGWLLGASLAWPGALLAGDKCCGSWLFVDNCATIPPGALPALPGTYVDRFINTQDTLAETDDFVIYKHMWYMGGKELGPYGKYVLDMIVHRLPSVPFPVSRKHAADVNLSPADLATVKERVAGGCQVLGLQFPRDPMTGSRFETLSRELDVTEGSVRIAGRDICTMPEKKIPQLRRNIGTVFQDFKLLPNRTVYDNVAYALQVIGASRAAIREQVPATLRLVGLSTKLHNFPDQLSGGEQQRVSVARAFVNHPPLLLADEPSGNLDPVTSIGIMQLLYRINKTGTTVVVVTHDREMVDNMQRRVVELYEGSVVRDEVSGGYTEESTTEFGLRMRAEMGVGPEGQTNGHDHERLF